MFGIIRILSNTNNLHAYAASGEGSKNLIIALELALDGQSGGKGWTNVKWDSLANEWEKGAGRDSSESFSSGVIDKRWIYNANDERAPRCLSRAKSLDGPTGCGNCAIIFLREARRALRHDVTWWRSNRLPAVREKEDGSLRLETAP